MNPNPIILHLESTSKNCSIAISKGIEILCLCEETTDNFSHNEKLHTFIQWALEGAEITINDINAISLSKGPGSYTGLRIGTAAAKGLCFSLDIPLIANNTLESLIQKEKYKEYSKIIPVIDARRMEFYTKIFDGKGISLSDTHSHILNEKSFLDIRDEKLLFIGDCTEKIDNYFKENNINFKNATFISQIPSAKSLVELSYLKYQNQEFKDIAYFEPFYLKDFIGNKLEKYK